MKVLRRSLWLAATLLLVVRPAMACPDVDMSVDCPAEARASAMITADVHLENVQCSDANVRLVSSIAGNESESLGRIGIFGPEVVGDTIVVPAATDHFPGSTCKEVGECSSSDWIDCFTDDDCPAGETCYLSGYRLCTGSFRWCSTNADCVCQEVTPGTSDLTVSIPPAIPASLTGTVAALVLLTEADFGGDDDKDIQAVKHCLVDVRSCFGDFNEDGIVNNDDLLFFREEPGCYTCAPQPEAPPCNPICDSNGDGIVNNRDLLAFKKNYSGPCP
jgi:hypothetical protein